MNALILRNAIIDRYDIEKNNLINNSFVQNVTISFNSTIVKEQAIENNVVIVTDKNDPSFKKTFYLNNSGIQKMTTTLISPKNTTKIASTEKSNIKEFL